MSIGTEPCTRFVFHGYLSDALSYERLMHDAQMKGKTDDAPAGARSMYALLSVADDTCSSSAEQKREIWTIFFRDEQPRSEATTAEAQEPGAGETNQRTKGSIISIVDGTEFVR